MLKAETGNETLKTGCDWLKSLVTQSTTFPSIGCVMCAPHHGFIRNKSKQGYTARTTISMCYY